MVTLMNKLRQPLTINLLNGKSVHLSPKGKTEITFEEFKCIEVKQYLEKEYIIIIKMN